MNMPDQNETNFRDSSATKDVQDVGDLPQGLNSPEDRITLAKKGLSKLKIYAFAIIFLAMSMFAFFWATKTKPPSRPEPPTPPSTRLPSPSIFRVGVEKFKSEEEFKAYLEKAELTAGVFFSGTDGQAFRSALDLSAPAAEMEIPVSGGGVDPERVSETTVQVEGIDEPDILKTDGKEIYFSSQQRYYPLQGEPFIEEKIAPLPEAKTKVIKAFPPAELVEEAEIGRPGNLLLSKKTLVIFSGPKIYGYDISRPESPQEKWDFELESKNELVTARLYQDRVYAVLRQRINIPRPCPIVPLTGREGGLSIRCGDIYHPIAQIPADITYTVVIIDPETGKIENSLAFVSSSRSSVVYMSPQALYITYFYQTSIVDFFYNFLSEKGRDLVPEWAMKKLASLREYEISEQSKLTEIGLILEQAQASLADDEAIRVRNEITNRMNSYYKVHMRELEKAGIVKIGLGSFEILASGDVPGQPLNQFSLDEHENHLRIATTVGGGWFGMFGRSESANDVYVLDKDLVISGSVQDLGLGERIYSARFIENRGYLVTFRQVDPFFVLDLSDPQRPELKGELKIPGYSSYLHPISNREILGIGKEGSQVKISLFDVSVPENPAERDKYLLDETWSDILQTHHAFLLDAKHKVFFLPGSKGGYIFSYQAERLELKKVVSGVRARRAIYISDYLYVVGDDKIVVLNEIDWEEVNQIELSSR